MPWAERADRIAQAQGLHHFQVRPLVFLLIKRPARHDRAPMPRAQAAQHAAVRSQHVQILAVEPVSGFQRSHRLLGRGNELCAVEYESEVLEAVFTTMVGTFKTNNFRLLRRVMRRRHFFMSGQFFDRVQLLLQPVVSPRRCCLREQLRAK